VVCHVVWFCINTTIKITPPFNMGSAFAGSAQIQI